MRKVVSELEFKFELKNERFKKPSNESWKYKKENMSEN